MPMRWFWWVLVLGCAVGVGCRTAAVRPVSAPDAFSSWRLSAVAPDSLSPRTLQTLRQYDLESTYQRFALHAFLQCQELAVKTEDPDMIFALAEMSFVLGRQAAKQGQEAALAWHYLCAGYSYHYIFGPKSSSFDPRFRVACDLYNAGLSECIRAAQKVGRLNPCSQLQIPTPDGKGYTLSVVHHGFAWRPEEFGPLLLCEDFRVAGLENQYRTFGLGVPLIGSRPPLDPPTPNAYYPRNLYFPVTAFFRFNGSLADLGSTRSGQLELYNPRAIQTVQVGSRTIPLESDLTTPLAYFLTYTEFQGKGYVGFLRPDKIQVQSGVYFFEPYQPGKIPVVLVHGLLSSPLTWAPLFNDLQADPVLWENYQFWFYFYPTANPYMLTAADLRQSLACLRRELDPEGKDAALNEMVLVGHSMGGLVSRLLTTHSGQEFWKLVSTQPFETLKVRPEVRNDLEKTFFFQPLPCVRRVVFLGTPHKGSELSPSWPARLARRFIRLPKAVMETTKELAQSNPQAWPTVAKGYLPTSLDFLDPNSPVLELMAHRPRPPGVHYHSVIGVVPNPGYVISRLAPGGTSKEGTDGVVPYTSAHLEGVDSEIVVPADHFTVHRHPRAVSEVRRILHNHLQEVRTRNQEIIPVQAVQP